MQKISIFTLMFIMLVSKTTAQQVNLSGKVINPDEKPIKKVLVYLANSPSISCQSDSLGNFVLTNELGTSVTNVRQEDIISFENQKLTICANNQSISVNVINMNGIAIKNILNLNNSFGRIGLYPEAYISDLPNAIYIVRARVGNTYKSFKIQNIIPTNFSKEITQDELNIIPDNYYFNSKSITNSEISDTLVLVHDFYKARKIPLTSYSVQFDTIQLNNFADYTMAESFEPSVTYLYKSYANFTDITSTNNAQFIIDYDTLSIFKNDLKIIAIPVDNIGNLDCSIKFISGLHFEPSGTKFLQPVQVTVLMKDTIPENLVVFHCNDLGETHYIPYETHVLNNGYCIVFNINHFSSIGIGTGVVPSTNPEGLTTSDEFISYLAKFVNNFDEVPEDIFNVWFNKVVVPMINKIITYDDLSAALAEFGILGKSFMQIGGGSINDLPFYNEAMEMFCNKMTKIWNDCVVEYNGLDDYCLKREILKVALNILALNQLNGDLCKDFSQSDMNDFGNGEFFNLANKIEFSKQVKHLEIGETYQVEYTLKSISGNPLPEVVVWTSSNPSVASISKEGKVSAYSKGETIITGKICDIENTLKVNVGGVNCEKQYCYNDDGSCYSRTKRYKCTGVVRSIKSKPNFWCGTEVYTSIERFTLIGELNSGYNTDYEVMYTKSHENYWNNIGNKCDNDYYAENDTMGGRFVCSSTALAKFYFKFDAFNYYVDASGYLKGDFLILDVKYYAGDAGYKNTKFFCNCINK